MALCDLPPELFTAIIGTLDLGSTYRLARTCRALVGLGRDHRHYPLYSAVRENDLKAFHRAVRDIGIPGQLVPSRPPSEPEQHLCHAAVACAWTLVVYHGFRAAEWWTPLAFIIGSLTAHLDDHQTPRYGSLFDNLTNQLFVRVVNAATTRSHMELLDCLRKFKDAAPSGWLDLDSSSDWQFLPNLIRSVVNNDEKLWTRHQQLCLLPILLTISADYFACMPDQCIIGALSSTQDLALIVTAVVEQNRFGATFGTIDFMTLFVFVSSSIHDRAHVFNILIKSQLAAIGSGHSASATLQAFTDIPSITFPSHILQVRKQLEQTYALAGISSSQFLSFMDDLHPSPSLDDFISWLLTCDSDPWPKQYHKLEHLTWLVSNAHPHVSMVHALPFHKFENGGERSIHTAQTLDFALRHIPVDLVGQQMHLRSPSGSRVNEPFCDGVKCKRCRTLMRAARQRAPTEPLLERFASGKWHLSYDPIPRDAWLAEVRAVAHLIRSMDQAPTSNMWMDYVDSVAPALVPRFIGDRDGTVDWFGLRDAGANRLSVSAVILGLAYEERFDEIVKMSQEEQVAQVELVDWARILDCIKSQVDRIQGQEVEDDEEDVRQEVLDNAAELVRALSGRCGKWMSEHCDFVDWAFAAEE